MADHTRLLLDTSIDKLKRLQHVIILKDTATVEQALKTLAAHHILSAPVVISLGEESQSGAQWPADKGAKDVLGFIDVRDILSSFLLEIKTADLTKMKMLQMMRKLEDKGQVFATTPLKELKVFGGDGDFLHVSTQSNLKELVMSGLLEPKQRGLHGGVDLNDVVHRVALYDNHGKITNIISQTDIVKFVDQHVDELGPIAYKDIATLGWDTKHVECVQPDVAAIEAMALMNEKKISAVAVVDGVGKIIGNFSVSEMRTIMAEHFGALALPVGEFLALEHGTEFVGYSRIQDSAITASQGHKFVTDRVTRSRPRTPGEEVGQTLITVKRAATFKEVVHRLVHHRIHRLYVIDDEEKPIGVITCTDIVRKLVEEGPTVS